MQVEAGGAPDRLIDQIYGTIAAPATWPQVLAEIGQWLGADAGMMLAPALPQISPVPLFAFGVDVTPILEAYPRHAGRAEFTTRAIASGAVPGAFLFDELIPPEEQASSDFWREIVAPLGVRSGIFAVLRTPEESDRPIVANFFRRSGVIYNREDVDRFLTLLTHIRRALSVMLDAPTAAPVPLSVTSLADAIGAPCFLVGLGARIRHANHAASVVLNAGDGLHVVEERLRLWDAEADAALRAALMKMEEAAWSARFKLGTEILARRPSGGAAMIIAVAPLGAENPVAAVSASACAAVFVLEEKLRTNGMLPARLRRLYGLTAAECAISLDLATGLGPSEIASLRGTAVGTVRAQVKSVLAKTGARRQVDLAALVNRLRF